MSATPIDDAKQRHRLADVATRTGISLTTTVGTVTVRCPLPSHGHPDRTPSMRLYLDDGHYYCFGCGARGDVIQWVRDAEGIGVMDAIRHLDSRAPITNTWAGVPTTGHRAGTTTTGRTAEPPDLERTPPERVRAAIQAAWDYYTVPFRHDHGTAYLAQRGIDVAVLEAHTGRAEVGHTLGRPDGLVTDLRACGFSDDELIDAGLGYRRQGDSAVSDYYRHRALIPVRDNRGDICGLIGRNVGDPRWPKYKNPPHTHAYDKSLNLYQPLTPPTARSGQVVVVEGTLDALAIATAAIKAGRHGDFCPVTQSGRELSASQLHNIIELHRLPPVLGFDSDPAGLESAFRYALAFARLGKAVAVARLGQGHDPTSWLTSYAERGLSAWSRTRDSQWRGPVPTPAASFAAAYIAGQNLGRVARMQAFGDLIRMAANFPGRVAGAWADQVAAVAFGHNTAPSTDPSPTTSIQTAEGVGI